MIMPTVEMAIEIRYLLLLQMLWKNILQDIQIGIFTFEVVRQEG